MANVASRVPRLSADAVVGGDDRGHRRLRRGRRAVGGRRAQGGYHPGLMGAEARAAAIAVEDLQKSYGALQAVRGVSFSVEPGEVFGLLGPNGAGKTTIVEILEGYRHRDAGRVEVLGIDPRGAAASCGAGWAWSSRSARSSRTSACARSSTCMVATTRTRSPPTTSSSWWGWRRRRTSACKGALRRAAAPPRSRPRAGRRSRAALPRRADHRVRPVGAAQRLGDRARHEEAGQDHPAHHPLHGRGPEPDRPGLRGQRRSRWCGSARPPACARRAGDPDPVRPARGGRGRRRWGRSSPATTPGWSR